MTSYLENLRQAALDFEQTQQSLCKAHADNMLAERRIIKLIAVDWDHECKPVAVPDNNGDYLLLTPDPSTRKVSVQRCTHITPSFPYVGCLGNAEHNTLEVCPQRMSCLRYREYRNADDVETSLSDNYSYPCIHYIKDVTVPPAASSANLQSSSGAAEQG